MTRNYYEEKSTTAQGRYDLHTELLSDIKRKMEALLDNAPVVNKEKVANLFEKAFCKLESEGNSILFDFFASDEVSTKEFICNIQGTLK